MESKIEPIKPKDVNAAVKGPLYESAISFINEAISIRKFHEQIVVKKNYNAIILTPVNHFNPVMDSVVEAFKEVGWDCLWSYAYDMRGPHYCFYVHEKHFTNE